MMRALAVILMLIGGMAAAQTPTTLADLQAELRALSADLQALRSELIASGPSGFDAAGGDRIIDRMDAVETQISDLTGRTEELENRIKGIVAKGSNRLGDIEFRLCELDETCDLGALMTADLGNQSGGFGLGPVIDVTPQSGMIRATPLPPMTTGQTTSGTATSTEQADFDLAQTALADGDLAKAASLFQAVAERHGGGPLTAEALYLRGTALSGLGQTKQAAESLLTGFSADPDGAFAPATLLALARAMTALGSPDDACPYLREITTRFPAAPETALARVDMVDCADLDDADIGDG